MQETPVTVRRHLAFELGGTAKRSLAVFLSAHCLDRRSGLGSATRRLGADLVLALLCGCATVDPTGDFRSAKDLVVDRTGAESTYDPADEAVIEDKVRDLLAGGLTVEEAVQVALLNNREFQASFVEIGISRADVAQSALLSNPTLALGFNFPEGGGLVDFTLSVAQQIADLWQIPIRKRIAEAGLERAILSAGRLAVQLAGNVRAKCYQLLALNQARELTAESVRLAERVGDIARRQFEAGQVSELDVHVTRTRITGAEAARIATDGATEIAQAELANLLGLGAGTLEWQLVDVLPEPSAPLPDADFLLAAALDQRLDARVAERDVDAAEDELVLQTRRVFPDMQLGLNFERPEQRALPGRDVLADTARASVAAGQLTAPTIESRSQRNQARSQMIDAKLGPSLAFTLPVWDQNQVQIEKARMRTIQSRKRYEGLLDRIALEVQTATSTARTSRELVRLHQTESVPIAEQTLAGATRLYETGQEDVLVLVSAEETLLARRQALVQAMSEYGVAMAQLESAVGGRLPEQPPTGLRDSSNDKP